MAKIREIAEIFHFPRRDERWMQMEQNMILNHVNMTLKSIQIHFQKSLMSSAMVDSKYCTQVCCMEIVIID